MESRGVSDSSSNNNKGKKTGGKRKIPIEFIKNFDARQVCFSKRRKGLFKKALELSVLCGARVRVLTFSPAGNLYSFISPSSSSPSSTLDQFFPSSQQADDAPHSNSLSGLSRQVSELNAELETLQRKNESLTARLEGMGGSVWNADLEKADLTQLLAMKEDLQRVVRDLRPLVGDVSMDPASSGVVPDMG